MKFGKSILSPSYHHERDFTSYDSSEKSFEFNCVNCKDKTEVKYNLLIGKEWGWKDNFDEQSIGEIKEFYDMNAVGKSPDGRWTAVDKISCPNCQTNYLVYAGVEEAPNSFYTVTIQGITEVLED